MGFTIVMNVATLLLFLQRGRKNSAMRRSQFKATDSFHGTMCHFVKRSPLLAMLLIELFVNVFTHEIGKTMVSSWKETSGGGLRISWDHLSFSKLTQSQSCQCWRQWILYSSKRYLPSWDSIWGFGDLGEFSLRKSVYNFIWFNENFVVAPVQ